MNIRRWINAFRPSLVGRRLRERKPAPHGIRCRPIVETLENRVVPTTWTVLNTNPTGPGSLFAAVTSANTDTTPALIQFDATFFSTARTITLPATLTLNNTSQPITVQGPTNVTVTISGNNLLADFLVNTSVTASLQNLTLTQGNAGVSGGGGGVQMAGGTLSINNCTISNCTAGYGGGIYVGAGNLLLENSLITNNSNPATGSSGEGGGLCAVGGTVTVMGCLFTQNASHVNFSGDGGAIYADGASMTVVNSTFTGNAANNGEYNYGGGAISAATPITIVNCTITANSSPNGGGGGIYNLGTTVNLLNDIVWSNVGSPNQDFVSTNGSYAMTSSLVGNPAGANSITFGPGGILNVPTTSSILGSLANNGGPTQTIAPIADSLPVGAAGNVTQMSSAISASATSISVSSGSVFSAGVLPTLASGSYYTIQVGSEQLAVVGASGSTLTVVRGVDGTTAVVHSASAPVYLVSDGRGLLAPFSTSPSVDDGAVNSAAVTGTGLSFYTQPPLGATVNAAFNVAVMDVNGGMPVAGTAIILSISSDTLNGTLSATTNASGVAVFSGVSVPSGGTYTLTATAGAVQATSNSFTVASPIVPAVNAISASVGSINGGATVIITGSNFTGATDVHFGATAASSFTVNSANQITAVAPAHAAGIVDITVTTPQGTSSTAAGDQFTYLSSVTLVVTNTNATGPGSLYNAVSHANVAVAPVTITFDPTVFGVAQTITLPSSLVLNNATQPITINGPSAATLTISGNSQNGTLIQDVMVLTGNCTLQNLTLTQGNAGTYGGGIANFGGGGAALLGGSLTITHCTISNNSASNGGGIYVGAGNLILEYSLITNNSNPTAASGNGGGMAVVGGTATVLGCLFTQNASHVNFGGGTGGAIYAGGTSMTVIDSTFTGNSASTGEYNYWGGAISAATPTTVVNCTITGDSAPNGGGGLYENQTTLSMVNDIVWNNAGSPNPDFAGTNGTYSASYSLLGSSAGANGLTIGPGDILNVPNTSSILGSLATNGGPTQTMAPVAFSLPVGAAGSLALLSSAMTASATTLVASNGTVFAGGVLPTLASGSYYTIQIGSEQMAVIGASGTSLTVVRGINGTTAAVHAPGASVYLVSDQRGYVVPVTTPPVVDMGADQTAGVNDSPTVNAVSPNAGPATGGTTVVITGTNFTGVNGVSFGSVAATSFTVNSATQITATAPAGTGVVDVTIVTVDGTSAKANADQFTYLAATTTSLTDNGPNPSTFGQAVSFTVTVSGGAPISGETVTIEDADDANAVVASPTLTDGAVTFTLANLVVGTHDLFAVYNGDATHASSNSSTTPVTQVVNTVAPAVSSVVINGGAPQYTDDNGTRVTLAGQFSVVEQILVTFNEPVTLDANAFSISTNLANFQSLGGVATPNTAPVLLNAPIPVPSSGGTQFILTFQPGAGTTTIPGIGAAGTIIKDGVYTFNTDGSKVHANSQTAADNHAGFWALFGSVAADNQASSNIGDGASDILVDTPDAAQFKIAFASENDSSLLPDQAYDAAMDSNLSGVIGTEDAAKFKHNFGTEWVF